MSLITSSEKQSDINLILLVANERDTDAYQLLFKRYASSVLGLSYRMIGDRAKAEEITQEVFWRVWQNADTFNTQRGTFTSWMFSIARNLSIDHIRRQKKVIMESLPDTNHDLEESKYFKAEDNVSEEAWLSLRHDHVRQALKSLPTDQKNVVEWIYFQGKTRREIAEEKNIPFGTINTRAKLAVKKLRQALEVAGVFEDY
ncbi:MAG: sigma-70 family RNA polymerase sigma factor [Chloroflexota bacterium]